MTNFAYVLMAAVSVLVLGGLIAGVSDVPGVNVAGEDTDGEALYSEDIGVIGNISYSSRAIDLGDVTVEHGSPNVTVAEDSGVTVSASTFEQPQTKLYSFESRSPEALYVTFSTAATGDGGQLRFVLNGHTEKTVSPAAGTTSTVTLTNLSAGSNTLLLRASDPGYRFWQTTRYELEDVSLTVNDDTATKTLLPFRVYDYEVQNFDVGTLTFDVTDSTRTAPLTARINNYTVYDGRPNQRVLPYEREFTATRTGLSAGENVLTFQTRPGASYSLSNVQIDIRAYDTTNSRLITETVQVPRVRYELMAETDGGKITFDVEQANVQKPMTISFGDAEFTLTPDGGEQALYFDKSDISSGQNELRIQTSGNYELRNFRIRLGEFEPDQD